MNRLEYVWLDCHAHLLSSFGATMRLVRMTRIAGGWFWCLIIIPGMR